MAKAKPRRASIACSSTRTVPIRERIWTGIEPGTQSDQAYPVAKKNKHSSSTRRITSRRRWSDRILENKRLSSEPILHILDIGLMKSGRSSWQEEEETRKDFSIVLILQEKFFNLRALQGHSGRNLIDPSLQDNVLIPDDFSKYIYHVGCAINLHSIINSGLIPGGQNLSKRQTVFFSACESYG